MSAEIAEGRGSKRWLRYPGVFVALLLLLLIGPSFCIIRDAGTGVFGVVLSADGQPIEGAKAYLRAPSSRGSESLFLADSNVTDSNGCFSLFSLHYPGTVEISIIESGYETFTATAPHGTLSVEIVMNRTGNPGLSRGQIQIASPGDGVHVRCAEDEDRLGPRP